MGKRFLLFFTPKSLVYGRNDDLYSLQAKPKIWVLPISEEDLVVPQFYLEPPIAIDGFNNAPFSWLQDPKVTAHTHSVMEG